MLCRIIPVPVFAAFTIVLTLGGCAGASPDQDADRILEYANTAGVDWLVEEGELSPDLAREVVAGRTAPYRSLADLDDLAWTFAMEDLEVGKGNESFHPCTYWEGMAQYYAIRALQCAYSAAWPMSGWYGYWAEHYYDLVEEHCY